MNREGELKLHLRAAANTAVEAYHRRCLEAAVARLGQPGPPSGIELLQLYNCGVVIRTAGAAVGIDVVTGRHVWGVNWTIADELVRGLAEHLDLLLVTERIPDHLDLGIGYGDLHLVRLEAFLGNGDLHAHLAHLVLLLGSLLALVHLVVVHLVHLVGGPCDPRG